MRENDHNRLSHIFQISSCIEPTELAQAESSRGDECGHSPFKRYGTDSWAHMSFI